MVTCGKTLAGTMQNPKRQLKKKNDQMERESKCYPAVKADACQITTNDIQI